MASKIPPHMHAMILDNLPHSAILRAAAVSRRWRAAATAHARFFRYLSLVHGEHSTVALSANPRVLRFFAQLTDATADAHTPLAVRVEIWAAETWRPADYACVADMVLPALRAAIPRVVELDVHLPLRHAGETFAAAPLLRGLVLGVAARAPAVPVPVGIFARDAPRLRAVRLQGMHFMAAERPAAFAKVRGKQHDTPMPEDRALSTLQLIDIERGPRPDAVAPRCTDTGFVPVALAISKRIFRATQVTVRYSPGDDVAPFMTPGGGLHGLRITDGPASVHMRPYASPKCTVTLVAEKADYTVEMFEAIAAAVPRAEVRALELNGALAPQFFAAFGGCTFAHALTVKIAYTRQRDAAAVLAALLRLLPARAVACGVRCPALRTLEIEWARGTQNMRPVVSRDQVLLLAAALGISASNSRVRLRIRGIDVQGGGTDCRRVFNDMFLCTIEA